MTNGRNHRLRQISLAACVACAAVLLADLSPAQETQFFLKNGDRVTARIVSEENQSLTLSNGSIGTFTLQVSQVDRRIPMPASAPPANAAPTANTALSRKLDELLAAYVANQITRDEYQRQRLKLLSDSELNAARSSTGAVAGPAAAVLPKRIVKITGEAQAGLDLGFATKDRQFYTGRAKLAHTQSRLRNAVDYSFTYGYTDGETSANRMDGSLKTDYDLTHRLYLYNLGGAGYDEIRKLDNYFQVGPGAGDHLVKLTNFVLNLEAGANFQEQNRADGTQTDLFYYRLAQDSKWTFGRLSLDQKIEFFPQWDDLSEYKLRFEANVKYWLNTKLFLNFSMIDLYDTMPAEGVEPNDLQIRSTIGVRF